ncbi:M48 family metalloprotease [Chitinophaga horti]|uniref:M48 family metalloprotease n=1 Tax=Chitinophaga horti TaxID=2920382 RepID=A0ABY6J3N4_9BACT|nr:M56 family metallopeptidase [Chitinophaga horti]UYQ94283.1 M48 family metalloprotease [Chitinophaga horti]
MTSLLPFTAEVIRAFGWTLLHSFWQAFVVFACLRIVLKIWPAASSAAKYHLSFLSLAGIFTWFVATFSRQLLAIRESQLTMQLAMDTPLPECGVANLPAAPAATGTVGLIPGMEVYFPVLVGIYIVGVVVMTIKLVLDLAQLQQIRRNVLLRMDDAWSTQVDLLSRRLGIRKKVQLHICASIQVPVMIGFLRPLILLPAAMVNNLSTDQLEAILLHELAHVKRHDYLLNIFQSIVETILFFNPFIWWISKNIQIEREHCCDDLVIASTVQPLHYAKALVALEEYRLTTNPMAMAIADNKQYLFHRIKRIMEMKTSHRSYSQQFLAVLIILTGVASIAWLNPAQKDQPTETVKKEDCVTTPSTEPCVAVEPIVMAVPPAVPETPPVVPSAPAALTTTDVSTAAWYDTVPGGKIVITDDKGNVKTYNSISEMPEADRVRMQEQFIKMQQAQENAREQRQQLREQMALQREQLKISRDHFKATQEAMANAYKNVDFNQLKQQIAEAQKNIDWEKMAKDAEKAYKSIDWEKMSKETEKAFKQVDWKKMEEDLQKAYKEVNWQKIDEQMQQAFKGIDQNFSAQANAHRKLSEADRKRHEELAVKQRQAFEKAMERSEIHRKEASKHAEEARENMNRSFGERNQYNLLLNELAADKLIDRTKSYEIEKKDGELYINGTKQPADVLKKYERYFKSDRVTLKGDHTNLNIDVQQ